MAKYNTIVFDFDYTLGDSTLGIILSINYALTKLGYKVREEYELKKTIGMSLKDTFCFLVGESDEESAELFSKYFKEKADKVMVDNTKLYDGVLESLKTLKKSNYKIGIVTTKYHYRIVQILKKYNAEHLVDLIVGAEDVKIEKPNPEGLLWVISSMGIDKEELLYVGDSLIDAKTAQNAGVDFAGVLTGVTKCDEFQLYQNVYIGKGVRDVCQSIIKRAGEKFIC